MSVRRSTSEVRDCGGRGFGLLEVLVVVAILAVVGVLLMPSLGVVRERARRVACGGNVGRFIGGLHMYGGDHDGRLPGKGNQYTPVIYYEHRSMMVEYVGGWRGLVCPSLGRPFDDPNGWHYGEGPVLGYGYLGGRPGTPWSIDFPAEAQWRSPQSVDDGGDLAVVVDLIGWSRSARMTFAPHGERGAAHVLGDYSNRVLGGVAPWELGAAGGNVGLLDGSVFWRDIGDMKVYLGARDSAELLAMW